MLFLLLAVASSKAELMILQHFDLEACYKHFRHCSVLATVYRAGLGGVSEHLFARAGKAAGSQQRTANTEQS